MHRIVIQRGTVGDWGAWIVAQLQHHGPGGICNQMRISGRALPEDLHFQVVTVPAGDRRRIGDVESDVLQAWFHLESEDPVQ